VIAFQAGVLQWCDSMDSPDSPPSGSKTIMQWGGNPKHVVGPSHLPIEIVQAMSLENKDRNMHQILPDFSELPQKILGRWPHSERAAFGSTIPGVKGRTVCLCVSQCAQVTNSERGNTHVQREREREREIEGRKREK
jgi:hypothetical protein